MGAGSFLASVARHSLLPVRLYSKATAQVHDIAWTDHEHQPQIADKPAGVLQPLLSSFHLDLAERLQQLQLHGRGNAHLNWLLDALAFTLSTHSSLQLVLTAAAASSSTASAAAILAKHRADEVLCMLDVCTALKQVADDVDRQFGCLQHALQSVAHALSAEKLSRGNIRGAACRLSAWLVMDGPQTNILCKTGKQYQPLAEARTSLLRAAKRELRSAATANPAATLLNQALDGAMLTSQLVLASAVCSLAKSSPRKSSGTITGACKMIIKYLGANSNIFAPWIAPLRQLHRDLRQEEMSVAGGALYEELQGLHSAASKLHATITSPVAILPIDQLAVVKQSVESLGKSLQEAQACIAMFRMHMASLFQALIALRVALLESSTA